MSTEKFGSQYTPGSEENDLLKINTEEEGQSCSDQGKKTKMASFKNLRDKIWGNQVYPFNLIGQFY